jgi:2-polyprenyl-6-methoxyphenol hydroxylase-like FAD-dependent oxidoreductase
MSQALATDVLIVGAGAAGLTLAIDLARRGVACRLVEQLAGPFQGSRGKGIQPRTQEVFEDLGVLDRLVAAGGIYPPQREYREDGRWVESDVVATEPATPAEPYHLALLVPQFITEAVMRERLAELGHAPDFGCQLVDFEPGDAAVTAHLRRDGRTETVRARYLVGADGGRSLVRHRLGVGFPGKTLGMRALVADVRLTGLDRNAWHRYNEGSIERQLAVCPLAGTELFQVQAPVSLEGAIDTSAAGIERFVRDRAGRADVRVQAVSWASVYQMNARLADRYRVGRVMLIGDAAHIHPPTGGQGLNTSVQDAYNLGWKLAAVLNGAPERLLETYEDERRPVAAGMLGLATRLLDEAKAGRNERGREVKQLDIGYRDGPLSLQTPRAGPLQPGDRAPDAPLRGAAGHEIRLFQCFTGTHWTLLGDAAASALVPPRKGLRIHRIGAGGELADEHAHFRRAYALSPREWVLVRPDGYVAAIVDESGQAALSAYLIDVGLPPADGWHARIES